CPLLRYSSSSITAPPPPAISTLSLHDALPIWFPHRPGDRDPPARRSRPRRGGRLRRPVLVCEEGLACRCRAEPDLPRRVRGLPSPGEEDRRLAGSPRRQCGQRGRVLCRLRQRRHEVTRRLTADIR